MFRYWILRGMLVLMVVPLWAQDHNEERPRVALVIGNANYEHFDTLTTPVNDADSMAVVLEKCRFSVLKYKNLNLQGMQAAIRAFGDSIPHRSGGTVLLFGVWY